MKEVRALLLTQVFPSYRRGCCCNCCPGSLEASLVHGTPRTTLSLAGGLGFQTEWVNVVDNPQLRDAAEVIRGHVHACSEQRPADGGGGGMAQQQLAPVGSAMAGRGAA